MNRDKIKIDWKFDRRPRVANSITKELFHPVRALAGPVAPRTAKALRLVNSRT